MLAKIENGRIVYSDKIKQLNFETRVVFNPTDSDFHEAGYSELPTIEHTEDQEIEYYIEDDTIKAKIKPEEPRHLSRVFNKSKFLAALKTLNLYDQAKALYTADTDLQIEWAAFLEIDVDSPEAQTIISRYPEMFSDETINAIIEEVNR